MPKEDTNSKTALYKLEVVGGVETATAFNEDGTVQSCEHRQVTPELVRQEMYEQLHTGKCTICLSKDTPVNKYNVCQNCEDGNFNSEDYEISKTSLSMLFSNLQQETINQYTRSILKAASGEEMQLFAKQFTEFCFTQGIAGKAFIEGFVRAMTRKTKYNTKVEQDYRTAFAWWKV